VGDRRRFRTEFKSTSDEFAAAKMPLYNHPEGWGI
jgi:hypothetical protein